MRDKLILLPAALLVIAIFPLPYGYYTFLRIVVTIAAGLLAWQAYADSGKINGWSMVFALVVLLFNPLVPVHMTREIWFFVDLGTAGLFAARWLFGRKASG